MPAPTRHTSPLTSEPDIQIQTLRSFGHRRCRCICQREVGRHGDRFPLVRYALYSTHDNMTDHTPQPNQQTALSLVMDAMCFLIMITGCPSLIAHTGPYVHHCPDYGRYLPVIRRRGSIRCICRDGKRPNTRRQIVAHTCSTLCHLHRSATIGHGPSRRPKHPDIHNSPLRIHLKCFKYWHRSTTHSTCGSKIRFRNLHIFGMSSRAHKYKNCGPPHPI